MEASASRLEAIAQVWVEAPDGTQLAEARGSAAGFVHGSCRVGVSSKLRHTLLCVPRPANKKTNVQFLGAVDSLSPFVVK